MARILKYNPTDPLVNYRVTEYLLSVNTPDYMGLPYTLINPDVHLLHSVDIKYWKYNPTLNKVVSMTSIEKEIVDANTPVYVEEVMLVDSQDGEYIVVENGVLVNKKKRDKQKIKGNLVWGTNSKNWNLIEEFEFSTKSLKVNDYTIFISLLAEATSSDTEFAIGIFLNDIEQTNLTRTITFEQKRDTKSLSNITYLEDVPVNSTISLKVKRVSSKNGMIQIEHRTFIIEED